MIQGNKGRAFMTDSFDGSRSKDMRGWYTVGNGRPHQSRLGGPEHVENVVRLVGYAAGAHDVYCTVQHLGGDHWVGRIQFVLWLRDELGGFDYPGHVPGSPAQTFWDGADQYYYGIITPTTIQFGGQSVDWVPSWRYRYPGETRTAVYAPPLNWQSNGVTVPLYPESDAWCAPSFSFKLGAGKNIQVASAWVGSAFGGVSWNPQGLSEFGVASDPITFLFDAPVPHSYDLGNARLMPVAVKGTGMALTVEDVSAEYDALIKLPNWVGLGSPPVFGLETGLIQKPSSWRMSEYPRIIHGAARVNSHKIMLSKFLWQTATTQFQLSMVP